MLKLKYSVVLEKNENGVYTATVPAVPGCASEGRSIEEALENISDALKGCLYVLKKHHRPIPVELSQTEIEIELRDLEKVRAWISCQL